MKFKSFKDYLVGKIPESEISNINRSYEIVGDIVILELNEENSKYENEIGNAFLEFNSNIKVVLKKSGIHSGEYRVQKLDYICGEKRKETTYLENGIKLKLNVEEVYFSAKLSTEREQLMSNLEPNKKVLVMFSGCGPYTFVALKKQPNLALIDSVELNPIGHKYALINLDLNKNLLKKSNEFKLTIENLKKEGKYVNEKEIIKELMERKIHFYNSDVKEWVEMRVKNEKLLTKYDEIFMPLPKDAELFLDCAFKVANKGCLIHMYDFVHENDFPVASETAIKEKAKENGKKVEIISTRKVGQYSPRKYRVCCDFVVK